MSVPQPASGERAGVVGPASRVSMRRPPKRRSSFAARFWDGLAGRIALATTALAFAGAAQAADLATPAEPAPAVSVPSFFQFQDTRVYVAYKPDGREPGRFDLSHPNGVDTPKKIVGFRHFHAWALGSNFFNLEVLKSNSSDPKKDSDEGATEVYAVYRGTLSFNKISGTKTFSVGPVKDLSFGFGFDANTKNTAFAPEKRLLVAGPRVDFFVPEAFGPGGVLAVQFNISKEWNHNGIVDRDVTFKTAPIIETVYSIPLAFTGLPLRVEGYTNFIFPRGKDGFGRKTATEINSDTKLMLDIGKLAFDTPKKVDVFVGYKYWRNKFGNDYSLRLPSGGHVIPGSTESSIFAGMSVRLF